MGLVLKASGSDFEANAVSYLPPVAEGLMYWGFLNDSVAKLGRNFAPGGLPVSVVGSPEVSSAGAVLDVNRYIQSEVRQTPSMTLIVVGNPVLDGAEQGMFISNYTSARPGVLAGISSGVSLYCGGDDPGDGKFRLNANVSSFSGVSGAPSSIRQASLFGLDIARPAFLAMTFDASEKITRVFNLSTGDKAQTAAFTESVDIGVTPFRIGASPLTSYPNRAKHQHFAAIYNRKLSEAELALIYTRIKAYLATRGVTV